MASRLKYKNEYLSQVIWFNIGFTFCLNYRIVYFCFFVLELSTCLFYCLFFYIPVGNQLNMMKKGDLDLKNTYFTRPVYAMKFSQPRQWLSNNIRTVIFYLNFVFKYVVLFADLFRIYLYCKYICLLLTAVYWTEDVFW